MTEDTQRDEAGGEELPDSVNKDITEDSQGDETAAEASPDAEDSDGGLESQADGKVDETGEEAPSDPAESSAAGDSQGDDAEEEPPAAPAESSAAGESQGDAAEEEPPADPAESSAAGESQGDDAEEEPPAAPAESSAAGESQGDAAEEEPSKAIRGAVKWFNAEKGFGFIVPEDGSADIFLHHSVLREMGLKAVDGGATIVCEVSQGPKGLQVARVIEVDDSTATPTVRRRPRSPLGYDRPRHETLTDVGEFVVATVKWFNPNKGFGFITVNDDSRDVFIHMQTLRRCGVTVLDRGQEVRVRIGQSSKGPQVAEIAPI